MQFRVRYIRRATGQQAEAIVTGPDARAVGWAVVERGDELISVGPAMSGPPPLPIRKTSIAPPKRPADGNVVGSLVAILLIAGVALPVMNITQLNRALSNIAPVAQNLERSERLYGRGQSHPPNREQAAARIAIADVLGPISACALGFTLLASALLISYRHRMAHWRWAEWQSRAPAAAT